MENVRGPNIILIRSLEEKLCKYTVTVLQHYFSRFGQDMSYALMPSPTYPDCGIGPFEKLTEESLLKLDKVNRQLPYANKSADILGRTSRLKFVVKGPKRAADVEDSDAETEDDIEAEGEEADQEGVRFEDHNRYEVHNDFGLTLSEAQGTNNSAESTPSGFLGGHGTSFSLPTRFKSGIQESGTSFSSGSVTRNDCGTLLEQTSGDASIEVAQQGDGHDAMDCD